ncbi:MAG: IS481 family transposase [Gemmatimonadota bacterium]|nr:MAG: IS481 family transposase [Gemmatimonadota bacterium]
MPWRETSAMNERFNFVVDAQRGHFPFAELCRRYGVSRKTGYKWLHRFEEHGPQGLADRSHRPHSCPHATPLEIVQAILELRRRRGWGAPKLQRLLQDRFPKRPPPTVGTIHRILDRHGLVLPKRRRLRRAHPGRPTTPIDQPNAVWSADFKGQFRLRNSLYCYPLTVQDGFSRFLLGCQGLTAPTIEGSRPVFERLFREYGLPQRIRTDNGAPFASNALGRLSTLSVWWVRLGILPELIEPGQPQQNGRHERMHKTLKARTTRPPERNLRAQQRRFDAFLHEFNHERPHEALGQEPPASAYQPSDRAFPRKLPPLEYPAHFEVRRVSRNGGIRWYTRWINVSHLLGEQYVGFEEIDDSLWEVYFGPVKLGRFHEQEGNIEDHYGRKTRHQRRKVSPIR